MNGDYWGNYSTLLGSGVKWLKRDGPLIYIMPAKVNSEWPGNFLFDFYELISVFIGLEAYF